MFVAKSGDEEYPVFSAGLDWLTCTAKNTENSLGLERLADSELTRLRATGAHPKQRNLLGFHGWQAEGIYFGRREHDVMLQLTGGGNEDVARAAIPLSSNVSRLDLQTTIYTEGSVVQLAVDTWKHLKTFDNGIGRPRKFSLTVGHPEGQTCYLNQPSSDARGRIYDKGVEAQIGPAGLLWRYEVQLRRELSKQTAAWYARQEHPAEAARNFVKSWMACRGCRPPWGTTDRCIYDTGQSRVGSSKSVLTWFEERLSKTVAGAVSDFGLEVVLQTLGLRKLIDAEEKKRNGNL